ncbi:AbrB/MazE/SpoVT family DNA-binding domain-containing protein [Variovorax defluvii]|uniref:AbrB/MazE/SpoVT family DNA-binding domain-containing protein n=1 Tax=Variovorax defluvii TaxID=913761 RepID=A0ABP8I6D6_9BURK
MQTTLTSKGQMTLPSAARARLGLEAGDRLLVTVLDDDTIILKRPPSTPAKKLRGLLPQPTRARSVEEMDAGIADHLRDKHRTGLKK